MTDLNGVGGIPGTSEGSVVEPLADRIGAGAGLALDLLQETPKVPGWPCSFSADRRYRYVLWRDWSGRAQPRYLMVIGLNPSTADETNDDPTIRRCIRFAKDWGFDALCMTNLFAFRATDPDVMKAEPDPIGVENNWRLWELAKGASLVLAAWGVHGDHMGRAAAIVKGLGTDLHALGVTKDGHPRHPLYMPANARPSPFPTST
jgi:hypothetical protein